MIENESYHTKERYRLSIPHGWYAVCYSHEINKKQIKPVSILNNEFILFRTEAGIAKVFGAYCPHQGTHLGYGGVISDNCIVCPFHHWHFNDEGKCIKIPYSNKIPALEKNALTTYPTIEMQGVVFMYYHQKNIVPEFNLPNFEEEYSTDLWTTPKFMTFSIKTHIHELGENGFDVPHFKYVHHSEKNSIDLHSEVTDKIMKFKLHLRYPGSGMGIPFSKIDVMTDWIYYGLGVFTNIVTLHKIPTIVHQRYFFTPKNNGELIIRFSLQIKKSSLVGNAFMKWLQIKLIEYQNKKIVFKNFKEDQHIWENKIYRSRPVLCDSDGPILHYRRWAQQFYSDQGPLDH